MHSIKFLFIVLVTLVLITDKSYSQINNPYEKEWKKVDDLSNKDLPGSAFVLVKLIYNKAKKERQDAQIIKSLIYMAGLQSEVREDNEIKSILEIEKEVLLNKEPATSILKSLLAG